MPRPRSSIAILLFATALILSSCVSTGIRIDELRQKANTGDVQAQVQLARAYDSGRGVTKDQAQAAAWYRKAAEQGYPGAQNALGLMYQNGEGVANDDAEAVRWFRKAADQGYAEAFGNLGYMYDKGLGVAEDPEKAAALYLQGAEKMDKTSMLSLGVAYWKGEGVTRDLIQAVKWLDIASYYSESTSDTQLKWRVRATLDEVTKDATLEEIHRGGQLAQEWEEQHKH